MLPSCPVIKYPIYIICDIICLAVINNLWNNLLKYRLKFNIRKYYTTCNKRILHMRTISIAEGDDRSFSQYINIVLRKWIKEKDSKKESGRR